MHWAETGRTPARVTLESKPLEIGNTLRELLLERIGTVVLTSATLAVGRRDGLDFVSRQLGVEAAVKLQLGSPFDYAAHASIRAPSWAPCLEGIFPHPVK